MLYETFEKGRAQGFKFVMLHRSNPYKPGTPVFEAWEREDLTKATKREVGYD